MGLFNLKLLRRIYCITATQNYFSFLDIVVFFTDNIASNFSLRESEGWSFEVKLVTLIRTDSWNCDHLTV